MSALRACQIVAKLLADLDSWDPSRHSRPPNADERAAIRHLHSLAASAAITNPTQTRRPPNA
jgi:hypothetical protein